MRVRTLLYLCRLGLKNLWHNRVYSAASIITMSACIFLFGIFTLQWPMWTHWSKRQRGTCTYPCF